MSHTRRTPSLDLIILSGTACSLLLTGCGEGEGSPLAIVPSTGVDFSQPTVSLISALQVNTTLDETDNDGTCSLREAILTVNTGAPVGGCSAVSNVISFDPGLSGTIALTSDLTPLAASVSIQGLGAETLTISGENSFRIFETELDVTVIISDLTLINGSAESGGGIFNRGELSLNRVTLTGNSAAQDGGALFNNFGEVVITASEISNNNADNDDGGGIDNNGGILRIRDSWLTGNSAADQGGAIRNRNEGEVVLRDSTLTGNFAADDGGAIAATGGTTQIVDSDLSNNSATDTGGAVFISNAGRLLISRSTVTGNTSNDNGAGLSNRGDARIVGSTFSGNVTFDNGGGIDNGSGGIVEVSTSVFDGNAAAGDGGGIRSTATLRLIRNTFTGNTDSNSLNNNVTGSAIGTGNTPSGCNDGNC